MNLYRNSVTCMLIPAFIFLYWNKLTWMYDFDPYCLPECLQTVSDTFSTPFPLHCGKPVEKLYIASISERHPAAIPWKAEKGPRQGKDCRQRPPSPEVLPAAQQYGCRENGAEKRCHRKIQPYAIKSQRIERKHHEHREYEGSGYGYRSGMLRLLDS